MPNRTAWTGGNGAGLTWAPLFAGADINASDSAAGLGNGHAVLSSQGDITNGTALDMMMDISHRFTIASSTIVAGACISYWLYALNQDGVAYGDNQFTAGVAANLTPSFPPLCAINIPAVATTTNFYGIATGLIIPPGTFRMVMQNNSGFAYSSTLGSQAVKYRTYNVNLNA
jgi:hypothetical protein